MIDPAVRPLRVVALEAATLSGSLPRWTPSSPLPSRPYIPGHTVPPVPRQHEAEARDALDGCPQSPASGRTRLDHDWCYGLDLFNHGFYWEAHEAWETLWHDVERRGAAGDTYKGMIKLSAAGVKTRQGSSLGRRRHAVRAAELFAQAAHELARMNTTHLAALLQCHRALSLPLLQMAAHARRAAIETMAKAGPSEEAVVVFRFAILPGEAV